MTVIVPTQGIATMRIRQPLQLSAPRQPGARGRVVVIVNVRLRTA